MLAELVRKAELGKVGIRDPHEKNRQRPLTEHLDCYLTSLKAKGRAPRYVELVKAQLQALFDGCGFCTCADFDADKVEAWLTGLRENGQDPAAAAGQGVVHSEGGR